MPTNQQMQELSGIITGYVNTSNTKVASDRLFLDTAHGGLGLFDVKSYVIALQSSWVKSAFNRSHDNWSYNLLSRTSGNPLVLGPALADPQVDPILHNISNSWAETVKNFSLVKSNLLYAYVVNNKAITDNDGRVITFAALTQGNVAPVDAAQLKVSDLYRNNAPVLYGNFCADTGIQITPACFMRVSLAVCASIRRGDTGTGNGSGAPISAFINSFKKGSKSFQKLSAKKICERQAIAKKVARNYYEKSGIRSEPTDLETVRAWILPGHSNRQRDFIFELFNNRLMINTRLSHVLAGVDRSCTFCTCRLNLPAPEETFPHLFWDCDYTAAQTDNFIREYIPEIANFGADEKKLFLLGAGSFIGAAVPGIVALARNLFFYDLEYENRAKNPPLE